MYSIGRAFTLDAVAADRSGSGSERTGPVAPWIVEVVLRSDHLQSPGLVSDFADLTAVGEYLHTGLDLNAVPDAVGRAPTLERLARHLFAWCAENLPPSVRDCLAEVRISQPPALWAAYARDQR